MDHGYDPSMEGAGIIVIGRGRACRRGCFGGWLGNELLDWQGWYGHSCSVLWADNRFVVSRRIPHAVSPKNRGPIEFPMQSVRSIQ